jgi:hypothetical protein
MLLFNNIVLFSIFIFNKIDFSSKIRYKNLEKNIIHFNYNIPNLDIDIKNNVKFLLNKNTKIYIHLEQLIPCTNIYHIGVSFNKIFRSIRYDIRWIDIPYVNNITTQSYTIFWDFTDYNIDKIIEYENGLDFKYILGIYDCRHYVRNLTQWSCNNPTPIWRLIEYIN